MRLLTCVSFIVTDEPFGEEPDHQSCRSEKRKERELTLEKLNWCPPHPQPGKPLSQRKQAGRPPSEIPTLQLLDPSSRHNREGVKGIEGLVNYGSVQLEGSFGPPASRRQRSFLTLKTSRRGSVP